MIYLEDNNSENSKRAIEADKVYTLIENFLADKEIIKALQEYKTINSWNFKKTLNIPATIASYYLFYMVTIEDKHEKYNKLDFILNVDLITTLMEQPKLVNMYLSCKEQIYILVECGLNLNVGFIWDDEEFLRMTD